MRQFALCLFVIMAQLVMAQQNFQIFPAELENLLKGQFKVDTFPKKNLKADKDLVRYLIQNVSADSLKNHMQALVSFENRNTIADDVLKPDKGIRGARNYILNRINAWSKLPEAVILGGEFSFEYSMCQRLQHTQAFAIIPGNGPLRDELVILEAHLDSRCEELCDTQCVAQGADDNASGSALLMELARVLSKVSFDRTVVLLWCTGEEQGLGGSRSFAMYCKQQNIPVKAVFNNDIVGGIECGMTSSPPGCPGPALVDSLRLRIFSAGVTNSMPKSMARLSRILVEQNLAPIYPATPKIDVMFGEDRSGRGGDHIPFREQGYTAIRLSSSYENGDGNPSQPDYKDRQHSSRDILGKDLNGDLQLDSFYVHFNYLKNNTLVNALIASNAASVDLLPFTLKISSSPGILNLQIENPQNAKKFVFGIRRLNSVFYDSIVMTEQPSISWQGLTPTQYYVSATGVDSADWIGMIGTEYNVRVPTTTQEKVKEAPAIELLQNKPNPFDELTMIPIFVHDVNGIINAQLIIQSEHGTLIKVLPLQLKPGINEILYDYAWHRFECGVYFYSLQINGKIWATHKMILSQF